MSTAPTHTNRKPDDLPLPAGSPPAADSEVVGEPILAEAAGEPTPRKPAGWVIPMHILAVALIQSTWMGVAFITPVLARKRFGANDWQTLLITATPTIFFSLSIFWNDLFKRRTLGRYLLLYWAWAGLPLALIAAASNYWLLLLPHLLSCIGGAGYHPASGEMLKALYPDKLRGRIYSIIWGSSMVFGAGAGFLVGRSMDHSSEAFRLIYPGAAAAQLLGIGVLYFLAHATGHAAVRPVDRSEDTRSTWRRVVEPISHMKEVLKADPIFARYEASFMTYGVGWMICYALLPILVTTKLHMDYESIAESTHVAYWLAMTAMIVPAGLLMDRIGAVRCTGLSFLLLTLYPLGLMLSQDARQLMATSIVYGVVHSGASVGWMLGPVSLAPNPEKVPQYVAIHATLVGVRGKVFQLLGVGLYTLTSSFLIPLGIAAAAMLWSAWQMWELHQRMERRSASGACPQCSYDRRNLPAGAPCPECGTLSPPLSPGRS